MVRSIFMTSLKVPVQALRELQDTHAPPLWVVATPVYNPSRARTTQKSSLNPLHGCMRLKLRILIKSNPLFSGILILKEIVVKQKAIRVKYVQQNLRIKPNNMINGYCVTLAHAPTKIIGLKLIVFKVFACDLLFLFLFLLCIRCSRWDENLEMSAKISSLEGVCLCSDASARDYSVCVSRLSFAC